MADSNPNPTTEQPLKRCSRGDRCVHRDGPWLPESEFGRDRYSKDGLKSACKLCQRADGRRYREANPDKVRESNKRYYDANQDKMIERAKQYAQANAEKVRARHRRHRKANPEKGRAQRRRAYERNPERERAKMHRYYEANRDKILEKNRSYRLNHPELGKVGKSRRRARKIANGGFLTTAEARLQFKAQTDKKGIARCWWCGKPFGEDDLKPSIDHRIPLAKGGRNDAGNIVWAHLRCNLRKNARLPWELDNPRLL